MDIQNKLVYTKKIQDSVLKNILRCSMKIFCDTFFRNSSSTVVLKVSQNISLRKHLKLFLKKNMEIFFCKRILHYIFFHNSITKYIFVKASWNIFDKSKTQFLNHTISFANQSLFLFIFLNVGKICNILIICINIKQDL